MKNKFSKRILSIVLALLMVVSSLSGITFVTNASYVNDESTDTASTLNLGSYQHAAVHDPSIIVVTEVTFTDGSVKEYPQNYDVASLSNVASSRRAYWIFGTHFDNAKSYDLKNWTQMSSEASITMFGTDESGNDLVINDNGVNAYQLRLDYPEFDAMCAYAGFANDAGDSWAGDIIWNNATQKWNYYGCVSSVGSMKSTIYFASSDHLSGGFVFGNDANDHSDCFVLVSGFNNDTKNTHPFLTANYTTIVAPNSSVEEFAGSSVGYPITCGKFSQITWTNDSTSKYPNSIDPGLFYDKSGQLWMSYGSWHNGIWIIPINDSTSLVDFSKTGNSDGNTKNAAGTSYDAYNGVKIANPESTVSGSGEGPFIAYDEVADVYMLTVTYGGLAEGGGYNTRCFYSVNPDGPYYDAAGNAATTDTSSSSNSLTNTGGKLLGDYTFKCVDYSYTSPGHNSMTYTDIDGDGVYENFFVYHSRYYNNTHTSASSDAAGPYFSDYIHRAFTVPTKSNGYSMVLSPFEFAGEPLTKSGALSNTDIVGSYSIISHGSATSTSVSLPKTIQIDSTGNVTGAYSGTVKNIGNTINGKTYAYDIYKFDIISSDVQYGATYTYYGVFQKQYDESVQYGDQSGTRGDVISFSIIGENNNSIWGYTSRRVIVSDTLNAADSKLSVSPQIYVSKDSSNIDMYGTKIYEGSYNYGAVRDKEIASQDFTAYIYLNSKYTLKSITDADTTHTGANISFTSVSTTDGVTKYKLSGNVSDIYDDGAENSLTLVVSYTDGTTEYEEQAYTYVMQTPVPAHAFGSSYNNLGGGTNSMENAWLVSAIGSYGSNGYQNYGDSNSTQTLAPNLCTKAELNKSGNSYYWNNPNHTADIKTGRWASGNTGTIYSSWDVDNNAQTTPVAIYYIDKSDYQGGSNISDYIDSEGNYSIPVAYNNITKATTTYNEGYSIDSNSTALYDNMVYTELNNATTRTAYTGKINFDQSTLTTNFLTTLYNKANDPKWTWGNLKGNTANGSESFFLATQVAQYRKSGVFAGKTIYLTCDIQYNIIVFDKSAVREEYLKDIVDENGDHLVAANYSTETWTAYQKALSETAAYLNNYKTFESDAATEKKKYIDPIKKAYENLFSYDEYTELTDSVQSGNDIIQFSSNKYITNGSDSLVGSLDALQTIINKYPDYIDFTTDDYDASDFWRTISAHENNYNAISGSATTAKADYYQAIYDIKDRISELRERADYQALYDLSVSVADYQNDSFIDVEWADFDAVRQEVAEFLAGNGTATDGVYTANDLTVTKYDATTKTSASGTGTITVDDTSNLSNTQEKINDLYAKLTFYKAKLKHKADYSTLIADFDGVNTYTNVADGTTTAPDVYDKGLGTVESQNYTISSWAYFVKAYDDAELLRVDGLTYTADQKNAQPKYNDSTVNSVTYDGETVYLEDAGSLSQYQTDIDNADNYLVRGVQSMKPIDEPDRYEVYNAAQALAKLADLDAYNSVGQAAINDNFAKGYILKNGESSAPAYATDIEAVYVLYDGDNDGVDEIYKNTTTGATDAYTSNVLNTLNTNKKTYTVTFNVYVDGIQVQSNSSSPDQYYFGENIQFNVPSTYATSDYIISKWTVQADDTIVPTILKDTDTSVNRKIQKDTTVEVYLSSVNSAKTKVIVVDYFGVQLDAGYADVDASGLPTDYVGDASKTLSYTGVDKDGNTVNHSVSVNESPYYTFTGWSIKKTEENVITVTQLGTRALPSGSYEVLDSTGTVNGVSSLNPVDLNTVLTFNSEISNFYAWVMSSDKNTWYVASYDRTFETLSRDCNTLYYKAITADQISECFPDSFEAKDVETYKTPYSFGCATTKVTLNGNDKFRVYCTFTSNADNENIKVVQAGVLAARGETVPSDFTKGATGVTTVAVNAISDYNTYTATTSVPSSGNVYVRSFVSYIYTDASGNSIPRVAYGPVVSCDSIGNITY